ncbi:general secretion pathway protein G [Shewanella sediminis HAW-EB3]|uniref:Type II secretion system core protein G n=1 Tax=Shewanella sediminis (strain HAW-EB3) TaxID=425104 RepID=A8FXR1_SHESH|nr:type II secretion system major pseudopilin GspG [Shewanella sediminis]ABV37634.1 general secretion pathway protein G [Shewanella sediminis HAW-EB3]
MVKISSLLRRKNSGFTLVELLIVITILGLLMSLVAPKMFSKVSSTQRSTAVAQMQNLETSLDTYRLDVGSYPANLQELRSSTKRGWDGPYLPKDVPLDPWGNPYQYESPGEGGLPYSLRSLGKDGQVGGTDDNEDIIHQ